MAVLDTWAPYFSSSARMQGRNLAAEGRVRQVDPESGETARAHVQGAEMCTVTIASDDAGRGVTCTCGQFAEGRYCSHVWATLVDIEDRDSAAAAAAPEGQADAQGTTEDVELRPPRARKRTGERAAARRREPEWVGRLALLRPAGYAETPGIALLRPFQVCYIIDTELSRARGGVVVELAQRHPTFTGWSRQKQLKINESVIQSLREPVDRELCAMLLGALSISGEDGSETYEDLRARNRFRLPRGACRPMLERMIATGRAYLRASEEEPDLTSMRWDERDEPWVLWMAGTIEHDVLVIEVELRRGDQRIGVNAPQLILGGGDGILIRGGAAASFDDRDAFRWVAQFRDDMRMRHDETNLRVPMAEVDQFMDRLYLLPQLPEIDLPESVARRIRQVTPRPQVEIFSPGAHTGGAGGTDRYRLTAKVSFAYEGQEVKPSQSGRFIALPGVLAAASSETQTPSLEAAEAPEATDTAEAAEAVAATETQPIRRDLDAERKAMEQLAQLGLRDSGDDPDTFILSPRQMTQAVPALLADGWRVTADQKLIHHPGPARLSVTSDIDWFELRGTIHYETADGGQDVPLPQILRAASSGRSMIELDDGSQGLLPQQWLAEHGLLTAIGKLQLDHLRFRSTQAALLDALLRRTELMDVDQRFAEAREKLRKYEGITAIEPLATFTGTLRPYQMEALGWFEFLRWFGIGGILADDMGLGKTVQVLAMLDAAYDGEQRTRKPTLIVVPRSVVFNWIDEAKRFAPKLRVQSYSGTEREALRQAFADHDVIVTSYGLMRRDVEQLVEHEFHYIVLDEAQAIKNPNSQSAKAARLIRAEHRLALTGTPVENHLGDLWSIFEYLNPGMLGSNTRFGQLIRGGQNRPKLALSGEEEDETDLADIQQTEAAEASFQIAQALRPFILRRTKKQVLKDLPEKTEQTIVCEMEPAQRQVYDELREHYRGTLLKQIAATPAANGSLLGSNGGAAMMVLEALLRLRQAACHPGLIDKARTGEPSAKLDALLESLTELVDEGHKALVFSQFTSMLGIVRDRLETLNVPHAYLDGRTRNRREIVERFQNDPKCPVFLISLKAGGLGLNLTAAEYVFILDPWWNPAVEQQAIDRTHRIGQTRHVFAYRMICQDTIEQRIAELQEKKRKLADAIVGGETSLLRSLTHEDLEMLLS